ncbi:MAG: hypothetical protein ABJA98_17985 [Acidobacteriota bacterium]
MIDGAVEAPGELHLPTPERRRKIEGLEPSQRFSLETAARIRIDEVVFDDPQAPRDLVVDDAGLFEAFSILLRKESQQVTDELLVVGP